MQRNCIPVCTWEVCFDSFTPLLVEWVSVTRAQPCQDHPHLPMNNEGFKELPPEEGIDLKGKVLVMRRAGVQDIQSWGWVSGRLK